MNRAWVRAMKAWTVFSILIGIPILGALLVYCIAPLLGTILD